MNDDVVIAERNDAEMMKRGHLWPHMLLPLKRWEDDHPGAFPQTGFLTNPGPPWIITIGTIWGGAEGGEMTYASAEEAVADGWVVD